ncbi:MULTISPECIES: acylphosphatase [Atopobiaceae]|uniref:acylphosphatase n=1 Tax=Parafannyhessea umbonata TaxID=604330 RepID=A0A1H9PWE8_9ACTN|nr:MULTISPECIES: acylphosphatase [Atopobiaceae]SEH46724.1 acylphosphatase [Parafannyhessea umbonata]SER52480.1 acylphosphatase [Parafannyhessea umbonata]SJZ70185.1 acylphosphatase [Olsenella sp. KH1P3]
MGFTWPWKRQRTSRPVSEGAVRRRLRYAGEVQAVGFRFTAQQIARRVEVAGWVENLDDGDVLVEVQGLPGQVDEFKKEVAAASASADTWIKATLVDENDIPVVAEDSFRVRY